MRCGEKRGSTGFTRRDALKAIVAAGAALPFTGIGAISGAEGAEMELDRFGGWKGKQFEATGFFRTEHDGERWWLVTPEGNAFISFGVNHYHAGWWAQDYNREHWVKAFGAERAWDPAWQKGFRDARLGPIHPANNWLAHEFMAKAMLGIDLDSQPRWG